jgi:hypothetical protein
MMELLSSFAFKLNLRRYSMAAACSQGVRSWRARCLWQWQGMQIAPLLSCHVSRFIPHLA